MAVDPKKVMITSKRMATNTATPTGRRKEAAGKAAVATPQSRYPKRMKGLRLPQRERVRSESAPMKMVVRVAAMALAATIQEMGRGSGVMLSYMKVLKYWFSTPQAN